MTEEYAITIRKEWEEIQFLKVAKKANKFTKKRNLSFNLAYEYNGYDK